MRIYMSIPSNQWEDFMIEDFSAGRRDVLASALAVVGSALFAGPARAAAMQDEGDAADPVFAPHAHDWDWLIGNWSVRHRRLRERLAGSTSWDEFAGTCRNWPLMGGRGNVDDN